MSLLLWGLTIGTIGKIVLGVAVLRVHVYILREHTIDDVVLRALKREQVVTIVGLAFIIVGYLCEVSFYTMSTNLLNCVGEECVAVVGSLLK